ncbi:MAG: GNAT family N-acetyltransferase [Anaerovoracaceae bacterium]|jgi:GNAT superfamily N-acetyltransferase
MMRFKTAAMEDYDAAFDYIEKLWTYNTYDKEEIREVYREVINDDNSFAFFLVDDEGGYHGFCHGDYFITFWMSGLTCYVSSIITNEDERGMGNGIKLMDHAVEMARERGCKAVTLDSGLPRKDAHRFYEKYGFEMSCKGFELAL